MSKRKPAANIENNKKRPKTHTDTVSINDISIPTVMFDNNSKILVTSHSIHVEFNRVQKPYLQRHAKDG
jgi:hypothetical protein